ncbi:MAG: hypothetical protein WKF34_07145 [Pyrinomonadaceae bacterium]
MELQMSDLQNQCEDCDGTGKLENPVMKDQNRGYGTRTSYATPVDCERCNGQGIIVTDSGQVVIDFLRLIRSKYLIS